MLQKQEQYKQLYAETIIKIMKAKGIIEIKEGLKLNNPTLKIKGVKYDWDDDTVSIECIFNEEGGIYNHSRSFTFSTDGRGELTSDDILKFINNDEVLKQFS